MNQPGGSTGLHHGTSTSERLKKSPASVSPHGKKQPDNSGCLGVFLVVAAIAVLFFFIGVKIFFGSSSGSTVVREALPAGAVHETEYYTDADGSRIHNSSKLEKGLRSFYKETGVQPYIYILPNASMTSVADLSQRSEQLYAQLFTDEGHFLLVFCDDNQGSFHCGYTVGNRAQSVMDQEAIGILSSNLNHYYKEASDEETIFSAAFEKTGKQIMTVSKSPFSTLLNLFIAGLVIVVILIAAIIIWLSAHHKRQKELEKNRLEKERVQQILNTPLEKFGDAQIEDLAQKYEHHPLDQ